MSKNSDQTEAFDLLSTEAKGNNSIIRFVCYFINKLT